MAMKQDRCQQQQVLDMPMLSEGHVIKY